MALTRAQQASWIAILLLVLIQASSAVSQASEENPCAQKKNQPPVTSKIVIKAPLEQVWKSIHKARSEDPELTSYKVLTVDDNHAIVRQTMVLPFFGEARFLLSLTDLPPNRIDYNLIESNSFKTFDGTWLLSPLSHGQSTQIDLTCYSELKTPVPQFLLRAVTARKMRKRLDYVKYLAEKNEKHS